MKSPLGPLYKGGIVDRRLGMIKELESRRLMAK
jgi:hypothetical protein